MKKKGCQTSRSVRRGNTFFHYEDLNNKSNSKLKLTEILELVFFFVLDIPLRSTATLTGRRQETVTDWFNMCREVCSSFVKKRPKMMGTVINPIQIDEARFAGKRKYNLEGYLMVINPLHRKTVMLNYTTFYMDEESMDLEFLGLKMVLTAYRTKIVGQIRKR